MKKLPAAQAKVLKYLVEVYSEEFGFSAFQPIMLATRLPRNVVRRACRALKRKGLAEFGQGLWKSDGGLAGSGYAATEAGITFRAAIGEKE